MIKCFYCENENAELEYIIKRSKNDRTFRIYFFRCRICKNTFTSSFDDDKKRLLSDSLESSLF